VLLSSGDEDACLCLWEEDGFDSGHRVHKDCPMSDGNNDEWDRDKEVLVPDGNCTEHEESGSGSNGRTSEELVEGVQSLTVDLGGSVESDKHAYDTEKHSVFAQKVKNHSVPPGTLAGDDCPIIVDESDKDIKSVCTSTDVTQIAENCSALLDNDGILPVDHDLKGDFGICSNVV
jgi:hypothetical protein